MPKTIVVCIKCKGELPSPIAFGDRESFESSTISGNVTKCPLCGSTTPCNKENMIFQE